MAEVPETLRGRFRDSDDPGHREPVIVTLRDDARVDPSALGMQVEHTALDGSIVTGTLDAAGLEALAERDDVLRVEPEGEMHALDSDLPVDDAQGGGMRALPVDDNDDASASDDPSVGPA